MTEYGIWSDAAGGFVDTGLYTRTEMNKALDEHRSNGDDTARIRRLCPDHADLEQPADACEDCAAEDNDTAEGDEEED